MGLLGGTQPEAHSGPVCGTLPQWGAQPFASAPVSDSTETHTEWAVESVRYRQMPAWDMDLTRASAYIFS